MSSTCCDTESIDLKKAQNKSLRDLFILVFLVNFSMFLVEFIYGHLSQSNALTADSLDMLGDAFVYSISLFVVGKSVQSKANASLIKGLVMFLLGLYVVGNSFYKILNPVLPSAEIMTTVGVIALIANAFCFLLLSRKKNCDLNVRSSWICSRNDLVANVGVILAGLLVNAFDSLVPDIVVGLGIAFLVLHSSYGVIVEAWEVRKTK